MKKISLLAMTLMIVMTAIVGMSCKAQEEVAVEELQTDLSAQIEEATIVGRAYVDNGNFALDYGDIPADGVILELYLETETVIVEDSVWVDENGEYRFIIFYPKEGEYRIDVEFQIGAYQLQYNGYQVLGVNSFEVQNGKVIIGPTFLLYKAPDIEDGMDELG